MLYSVTIMISLPTVSYWLLFLFSAFRHSISLDYQCLEKRMKMVSRWRPILKKSRVLIQRYPNHFHV